MKSGLAISTFMRKEGINRRLDIFKRCINTFIESEFDGKLFIVDDGSEIDDHLQYAEGRGDPRIRIHKKPENRGVAAAKNTGIRLCLEDGCDVMFLSDDDMVFEHTRWFAPYEEAVEKTGIGHFSYAVDNAAGLSSRTVEVKGYKVRRTDMVNGCFLVVTADMIKQVGYFKILPYKYGHEHSNFSIRCKQKIGEFYDVLGSNSLVHLNIDSLANCSIKVDQAGFKKNEEVMYDMKKMACIE